VRLMELIMRLEWHDAGQQAEHGGGQRRPSSARGVMQA